MKGRQNSVELFTGCFGFPLSSRSPPDTASSDELTSVNELTGLVLVVDDDVVLSHRFGGGGLVETVAGLELVSTRACRWLTVTSECVRSCSGSHLVASNIQRIDPSCHHLVPLVRVVREQIMRDKTNRVTRARYILVPSACHKGD